MVRAPRNRAERFAVVWRGDGKEESDIRIASSRSARTAKEDKSTGHGSDQKWRSWISQRNLRRSNSR